MKILLLIGTGGFFGSIARYLAQQSISKFIPVIFPVGTLTINIVGSFLIGVIYAISEQNPSFKPEWRFFLATGFCGGFTTFSAFSLESFTLLKDGSYMFLSLYVLLSVALSILATVLAIYLVKYFLL